MAPRRTPQQAQNKPCPSSFLREVGGSFMHDGGVGEDEMQGGTQEVGGPCSASQMGHNICCGPFSPVSPSSTQLMNLMIKLATWNLTMMVRERRQWCCILPTMTTETCSKEYEYHRWHQKVSTIHSVVGLYVDTMILLALCISTNILLLYIYLELFQGVHRNQNYSVEHYIDLALTSEDL